VSAALSAASARRTAVREGVVIKKETEGDFGRRQIIVYLIKAHPTHIRKTGETTTTTGSGKPAWKLAGRWLALSSVELLLFLPAARFCSGACQTTLLCQYLIT